MSIAAERFLGICYPNRDSWYRKFRFYVIGIISACVLIDFPRFFEVQVRVTKQNETNPILTNTRIRQLKESQYLIHMQSHGASLRIYATSCKENLSFSYEPFFSRLDTAGVWKDDRRICMYVSQRALLTCLDSKSGKKIDIDWLDANSAISKRIHSQCGGKAEIGKFFSILRYVAPSGTLMSRNPREMSDGLMIRPSIFYVVSQKLPRYYQKRKRTIQKDNYSRIRMLFPFF